jgi:transmembrane sensor
MRPEEVTRIVKELEPPWNDLREQRLLARIQEERRRQEKPPTRRLVVVGAIAVAAACGALAATAWHRASTRANVPVALAPEGSHEQRIALADGSQALLLRDADFQVVEQRRDLVHIAQKSGAVRYEVRPDPAREFVVFAAGTTVRVRGTVFTVDVEDDRVEVRVQRGRVEVDDGVRTRELVVGESLGIPVRSPLVNDRSAAAPSSPPARDSAPAPATAVSTAARPTVAELLDRADRARAAGDSEEAAAALRTLVASFPGDTRVPDALFTLGRVDRARQRLQDSARDFDRCWRAAPNGPLAEDAIAEAAASWQSAGSAEAARADARRYLDRWPDGIHATQMQALMKQ